MIIKDIPIELLPDFIRMPQRSARDYANYAGGSASIFYHNWENIKKCYRGSNPFNQHSLMFDKVDKEEYLCKNRNNWRFGHIDLSKTGDACGICFCHIPTFVYMPFDKFMPREKRELFPYVVIDFLGRIIPSTLSDGYVDPASIREIVFDFRRRGFPVLMVTYDGYQSWESILRFRDKNIISTELSIDRTTKKILVNRKLKNNFSTESTKDYSAPHENFRNILQDLRIELPKYPYLERELRDQDEINGYVVKMEGGTDDVLQAVVGSIYNACNNVKPFVAKEKISELSMAATDLHASSAENHFNEMLGGTERKVDGVVIGKKGRTVSSPFSPVGSYLDDDYFNEMME